MFTVKDVWYVAFRQVCLCSWGLCAHRVGTSKLCRATEWQMEKKKTQYFFHAYAFTVWMQHTFQSLLVLSSPGHSQKWWLFYTKLYFCSLACKCLFLGCNQHTESNSRLHEILGAITSLFITVNRKKKSCFYLFFKGYFYIVKNLEFLSSYIMNIAL